MMMGPGAGSHTTVCGMLINISAGKTCWHRSQRGETMEYVEMAQGGIETFEGMVMKLD